MTAKEDCFADAVKKYERMTDNDTGIEFQKAWGYNTETGAWTTGFNHWWHAVRSLLSLGSPIEAIRRPDITINNSRVLDLKFTRSNGAVDSWGTNTNSLGNNQQQDYNSINNQNQNTQDGNDPSLTPDKCGCNNREPQSQTVPYYELSPAYQQQMQFMVPFVPLPAPGLPMPGLPSLPSLPPMGAPIPVFP